MKFAVIQFPGSNCDQDCVAGINGLDGLHAEYVWHKETSLDDFDAIVLPGGFAYGDYLRCGAIARFSPVMKAVISDARAGKLVLGTCNGFQILCEAGLLPGALVRNRSLRFVCDMVITRVEVDDSPFTHGCPKGSRLHLPVAHGEGCFFADAKTLRDLNANEQVILRYADRKGRIVPDANPNGSIENIAGICNREGNVFGLMPHPDRASDARLGSAAGAKIFRSMVQTIRAERPRGPVSDAVPDGISQSGTGGSRATQTGSRRGELRGNGRIKRPTIGRVSLFVTGTHRAGKAHVAARLLLLLRASGNRFAAEIVGTPKCVDGGREQWPDNRQC